MLLGPLIYSLFWMKSCRIPASDEFPQVLTGRWRKLRFALPCGLQSGANDWRVLGHTGSTEPGVYFKRIGSSMLRTEVVSLIVRETCG